MFLQQLAILQHLDLKALGHNSADYLHAWIECAKLAFADREAYYGDPGFDAVPFDVLLSAGYGQRRAAQIGQTASLDLRPGDVGGGVPEYAARSVLDDNRRALGLAARHRRPAGDDGAGGRAAPADATHLGDTTHLDAVDAEGNMVAATPSGGWIGSSPVIAGLGFPLGTRGQMFYLNPRRPNALQPRKRPRATLTPTIVTREGAPFLAFGTPGGDGQDQWTLQFFLNYVEFGLDLQQALDAPTVHTTHFPSSFYPRAAHIRAEWKPSRVISAGDTRGVAPARPRHQAERRLESRQGAGDPLPRRPRPDSPEPPPPGTTSPTRWAGKRGFVDQPLIKSSSSTFRALATAASVATEPVRVARSICER